MKNVFRVQSLIVKACIAVALLVPQLSNLALAAEEDNVKVETDQDSDILLIRISANHGHVAWSDILRALLRTGQLDDKTLKDKLPSGTLDLTLNSSRFVILGFNMMLGTDIDMRIVSSDESQDAAHVLVTIDQGRIRKKRRSLSKRIRDKLRNRIEEGSVGESFGLQLPNGWQRMDINETLVIVVHGYNSSSSRFQNLSDAFHEEKLTSGTYSYPDDQPITDSALRLSVELKELAAKYPKRTIALVTHSMGGLVSRAVVESPEFDPGNIIKLIMVAPPSHGSLLANFSYGLDILDHAFADSQRGDVSRLYAVVADGLNEAAVDLKPGSQFLRKLNARSRNPNIHYSIFLGTGGRLTQEHLENFRQQLKTAQRQSDVVELFTPHLDEVLADLEEVVKGKGDGVVAVKRGRLEGVKDTEVLNFTHLDALQDENQLVGNDLFEAVLTRLRR
ncbi:MAG: hypothetical protein ABGX16_04285 [Pirellulales bacterium]